MIIIIVPFYTRIELGLLHNTSLLAKGALAHHLQCRTSSKTQNGFKIADGVWRVV